MAIKKDQIISAVKTRLQTITTDNGYNTNAGNNVFEGRTTAIPDSQLPAINILEGTDTFQNVLENGAASIHERILELDFEIVTNGNTVTQDLRKVEADVIKAIGVDETFGSLAVQCIPGDVVPVYDKQQEKKLLGKVITIGIAYRITAWQNE